jgi:hypothetical protein
MSKKKFFTRQAVKEGLSREESKELYLLAIETNSNLNAKEAVEKHLKKNDVEIEDLVVAENPPSQDEPVVTKKSTKSSKK